MKMNFHLAMWNLVVFLISFACVRSEVTIEDGGYSVLVSFSQNVPSEAGMALLENMKAALQETSKITHEATGLQFSKVTFKIPGSWDISEWNLTTKDDSTYADSTTDFLIDNNGDTVFGKFPVTLQYGNCGTPGHQIIVPVAFFDEENEFPQGISLAREFLKYRYGVFDENGYSKDPLYPLYYNIPGMDPNEITVTGCTNEHIVYDFMDNTGAECVLDQELLRKRLDSEKCEIHAEEGNLENITSSLMYFQKDIKIMKNICGGDFEHNSRSPNKQNALCYGESIWDVVKTSRDFRNQETGKEYFDIEYVYIQDNKKPTVVVAWENTAKLSEKGHVILKAINKLIIDLSDGSKFSGFPFTKEALSQNYTLHVLNSLKDRRSVAGGIVSKFQREEDGDIKAAFQKCISILYSGVTNNTERRGSYVIMITGTKIEADSPYRRVLKQLGIELKIIHFEENIAVEERKKRSSELLADDGIDKLFGDDGNDDEYKLRNDLEIGKESDEVTIEKLMSVLDTISPSVVQNKATETAKWEYLEKEKPVSVEVDDSVETSHFWIFSKEEPAAFQLKLNGELKETGIKTETIGDVFQLSYSPTQPGLVELSYKFKTNPLLTQVQLTSKEGRYFTGEVIVRDTTETEDSQMPVIIYAIIHYGGYPVQNANITATIERPNEEDIELELYDDGKGDPDITQNDGIYSRYFTHFTEKGEYSVIIKASNGDSTTIGKDENPGYRPCCGSAVTRGTEKLAEFSKVYYTTFSAVSGRPEDGYKPSRISDLRVDNVDDDKITLKWTAPGEEADSGAASTYEIKLFCDGENVTESRIQRMVKILDKPSPLNYGTEQEVTLEILVQTWTLSLGIITKNENNKMSDLSNIVEIFRGSNIPPDDKIDPVPQNTKSSQVGTIVGCVIGGLLLVACILGLIYYSKKKQANLSQQTEDIEGNKNNSNAEPNFKATDHSVKSVPIKKIDSFPVLLYTHDQIKDHKTKGNDLPLYETAKEPKQWKSLDVISSSKKEDEKDAKSLSSADTAKLEESSDVGGIKNGNSLKDSEFYKNGK